MQILKVIKRQVNIFWEVPKKRNPWEEFHGIFLDFVECANYPLRWKVRISVYKEEFKL
jgi:hypothetical protein